MDYLCIGHVLYELQCPSHDCHVGCNVTVQELFYIIHVALDELW